MRAARSLLLIKRHFELPLRTRFHLMSEFKWDTEILNADAVHEQATFTLILAPTSITLNFQLGLVR